MGPAKLEILTEEENSSMIISKNGPKEPKP